MTFRMRHREPLLDLALFARCTPAQASRVRSQLTLLDVPAGTVLMAEGTFGFEFIVIAAGEARVTVETPGGEAVVAALGAGDFAGEMSLLGDHRRTATVTAVTDLTVYACNAAEFAAMLDAAPSVAERVMAAAAARRVANQELCQAA